jgi:hypothetical protein
VYGIAQYFGILTAIDCGEDLWIVGVCGVILGLVISAILAAFIFKLPK